MLYQRFHVFPFNPANDWTIPVALVAIPLNLLLFLTWLGVTWRQITAGVLALEVACFLLYSLSTSGFNYSTLLTAVGAVPLNVILLSTWFRLTPSRVSRGLLAMEAALFLCERALSVPKGSMVLIALAMAAGTILVFLLWWSAALLVGWPFQFTVRSLLLFVVVVAIPCCWLAIDKEQAREQEKIIAAIKRLGCTIGYDYEVPTVPHGLLRWQGRGSQSTPLYLRQVLGEYFFTDVVIVRFGTKVDLKCLEGLRNLRRLSVHRADDADLRSLEGLTSLEVLCLRGCNVSDAGLAHLRRLTNLTHLDLGGTKITDAGLVNLKGLSRLGQLWLVYTTVTGKGVRKLHEAIPNCHIAWEGGWL